MSCKVVIIKGLEDIKFERLAWLERAHDARNFAEDALRNHIIVKLVNQRNFGLGLWQYHIKTLVKNCGVSVWSLQINTRDRGPVKVFAKWILVCDFLL
jgi:hypothetical protein